MKKNNNDRMTHEGTYAQLISELSFIFPGAKSLTPSNRNISDLRASVNVKHTKSNLIWIHSEKVMHVFLSQGNGMQLNIATTFQPLQYPTDFDIRLTNAYVRLFQEDCLCAPDRSRHKELWETLTFSRIPRTIARITSFTTANFLDWLTVMESATHLKYEGRSFQSIAIMSKQAQTVTERVDNGYLKLKFAVPFRKALLNQKWIRAISHSSDIALHGVGHSGEIQGIVDLSAKTKGRAKHVHKRNQIYNPELKFTLPSKLKNITRFIVDGTVAFVCAANGDLYLILPSGICFLRTQGRWHYLNFASFELLLSNHISKTITPSLLSLLLDLSFDRKGALICILSDAGVIKSVVPDYGLKGVPNYELRCAIAGSKIDNPDIRHILKAAATVDGSMIIRNDGTIVDVACMIGEPSIEVLRDSGLSRLERFDGARSTAAWNASMHGISIKISEDGPISVFLKGKLLGQLG